MQPEYGLPTGPLASRLKAAGASPVDNPAATYIPAYLSLPSFRLIPELEWTPARHPKCEATVDLACGNAYIWFTD